MNVTLAGGVWDYRLELDAVNTLRSYSNPTSDCESLVQYPRREYRYVKLVNLNEHVYLTKWQGKNSGDENLL